MSMTINSISQSNYSPYQPRATERASAINSANGTLEHSSVNRMTEHNSANRMIEQHRVAVQRRNKV